MSLHYILDGYNIIYQMPMPMPDKLEDQRHQLVRYIETRQPQGSLNNTVTIVFDGQSGGGGGRQIGSIVSVAFSQDENADDLIERMVARNPLPKSLVVVSDDRAVQKACRLLGARIQSVSEFMGFGSDQPKKHGSAKNKETGPVKQISQHVRAQIDQELSRLWIRSRKKPS